MNTLQRYAAFLVLSILFGCGENIESISDIFGPPQNLKAVSVNESTVGLQWSAAGGASDSLFQGYIVQWEGNQDSVSKSILSYNVDSLSSGVKMFTVRSLRTDGRVSDEAIISWAPAARFDSAYVLDEFSPQNPTSSQGFSVGSQTADPATMPIDANAQQSMDLYCFGGVSSQVSEPLALWSADLYQGGWRSTRFSNVTDASASLDYYLSSFPDATTFTKDTIAVNDNTIYYVRLGGNNQQVHYARLQIRVLPGFSFPARRIAIRVSLQRVPDLLFAFDRSTETRLPLTILRRQLAVKSTRRAFSSSNDLWPLAMVF